MKGEMEDSCLYEVLLTSIDKYFPSFIQHVKQDNVEFGLQTKFWGAATKVAGEGFHEEDVWPECLWKGRHMVG